MSKHRGLVLAFILFLTIFSISSVSSAAPQIVGSKCVKAGSFRTAKNVKYQCKKSAQGLRWVKVSTNRRIKAMPTAVSTDAVNVSTQQLIGRVDVSTGQNTTQVVMHVEAGSNGNWPNVMEGALEYSLNFYSALGFTFTQPRIDFVLGRTQPWLKLKFGELFPGCWSDSALIVGGYALCANPDRGGIGINLVSSILPNGLSSPDADVSQQKRDVLWAMVAHEAWHNWQQGIGYTYGAQDLPAWWIEGGAVYFSVIAWAKSLNKSQTFDSLWPWEFEPNELYGRTYEQQTCTMRISELSNVCAYSKGALLVQYFVYRFGVDAYQTLYSKWQTNLAFAANFQRATGMALDQFYGQAEDWLASRGWKSK